MFRKIYNLCKKAEASSGYEGALEILEKAHLEYQLHSLAHFYTHWLMFRLALRHHQWEEVVGQIPRMVLAVPGSVMKMAPRGNVGSTKMGIFEKNKDN